MKFGNPYFEQYEKISLLQRWLIVHSIIYYELGDNIVPDSMWDKNARQLAKKMEKYPKSLKKSTYYYCMHDFDPSSGYYLFDSLNEHDKEYLYGIAVWVLKRSKAGWK